MHETLECRQVHALIRSAQSGAALLSEPALAEHLRTCSACAVLVEGEATLGGTLAAAEDETQQDISIEQIDRMLARIEAETARPPSRTERIRQASTRTRGLVLFGAAASLVALASGLGSRVDLSAYPLAHVLGAIAALVASVLAAGAVVLRPIHRKPLPGWLLGALAGFAVITPGVIAALPGPAEFETHASDDQFVAHALACFVFGMVFALVLIGVAWMVERSGLRRRAATVLGLVGAGALGNLLLVLHCPNPEPLHKLAGHATISAVLLAAAGVVVWWLTIRPSSRP